MMQEGVGETSGLADALGLFRQVFSGKFFQASFFRQVFSGKSFLSSP